MRKLFDLWEKEVVQMNMDDFEDIFRLLTEKQKSMVMQEMLTYLFENEEKAQEEYEKAECVK